MSFMMSIGAFVSKISSNFYVNVWGSYPGSGSKERTGQSCGISHNLIKLFFLKQIVKNSYGRQMKQLQSHACFMYGGLRENAV